MPSFQIISPRPRRTVTTRLFTSLALLSLAGCASGPQPAALHGVAKGPTAVNAEPELRQTVESLPTTLETAEASPPVREDEAPTSPLADDLEQGSDNLWHRIQAGMSLEIEDRPAIRREMDWFGRHPEYLARVTRRGEPYLHHIVETLQGRGMPLELSLLPIVESGFQPFAYSSSRASGIWQIIPATGRRLGLKQNWWYDGRRDITAATDAALDYLELLHKKFDGDWPLAIAAYNCGEGTVARAIRRNKKAGKPTDFWHLRLPRETRGYVPRLLALAAVVSKPGEHGLTLSPVANQAYFESVELQGQMDLARAAELSATDIDEIYRLNPGFNRWATDPQGPHKLLVPVDKAETFRSALADLEPEHQITWQRHKIRSGESLIVIARKYNTTPQVIREVNKLKGNLIRAGRNLLVPIASKPLKSYALSADARRARKAGGSGGKGKRRVYTVRSGDSLWSIARRHGASIKQLARWNGMATKDVLRPGRKLSLWNAAPKVSTPQAPAKSAAQDATTRLVRYTVREGESLWRISRRFQVSIASLRKWNNLGGKKYLQPGQKLRVYVDVTRQSESI